MASSTSRLTLPLPVGSDAPSELRIAIGQLSNGLDESAVYSSGTIAGRAGLSPVAGEIYYATDTFQWSAYNGSAWQPLNLRFRANVSGTATLTAGDCATAAPSAVLTLPAASTSLAPVEIAANGSVTAASPVTVNGSSIFGPGLSAASTFTLGAPLAAVVLVPIGSTWMMISGAQDTGWVALTLTTGIVAYNSSSYYAPAARLQGDRVALRGAIRNNTGSSQTGTFEVTESVLGSVPSGFKPSRDVIVSPMNPSTGAVFPVQVSRFDGSLGIVGTWANGGLLFFDDLGYPVL